MKKNTLGRGSYAFIQMKTEQTKKLFILMCNFISATVL